MAKDPAMLWYWGDWHSGTSLLSRFLKGCYIDLLHAQFNFGPLSLEEIKTCLGSDFGTSWPALQKKFKQTEKGLFFNERLEQEKTKRQKYSESRRENVRKKHQKPTYEPTYVEHMNLHMENENENGFKLKKVSDFPKCPGDESLEIILPEIKINSVIELMKISKQVDLTAWHVQSFWTVFKNQNFTGKSFYNDISDVYKHFINWMKLQSVKGSEMKPKQPQIKLK